MENTCFFCGKVLGQVYFHVVVEIKEEVDLVGVCEKCAYALIELEEENNNNSG